MLFIVFSVSECFRILGELSLTSKTYMEGTGRANHRIAGVVVVLKSRNSIPYCVSHDRRGRGDAVERGLAAYR